MSNLKDFITPAPFTELERMSPIATDSNWEKYIYNKALYAASEAFHQILRETDQTHTVIALTTEFLKQLKQLQK